MRWFLLRITLVFAICIITIIAVQKISTELLGFGFSDFRAYWSAARLLVEGKDFYDPANMLAMELSNADPNQGFTMMVWNPPTTFALLVPLAFFPFHTARAIWALINLALVLGSCLMIATLYLPRARLPVIAFLAISISFSSMLVGIWVGQITFLVFFGLSSSIYLIRRGNTFAAGAALFLTTVKPHLILLALPYLLLYMLIHRKWWGWVGLLAAAIIDGLILFALRSIWINDLFTLIAIAPIDWVTPTIGGVLVAYGAATWIKYFSLLTLLIVPVIFWYWKLNLETAISLCILITVPTTFFGWSYDQTILLIPIGQLVGWSFSYLNLTQRFFILGSLTAMLIASFAQRIFSTNEMHYVWVPIMTGFIYASTWYMARGKISTHEVLFRSNLGLPNEQR